MFVASTALTKVLYSFGGFCLGGRKKKKKKMACEAGQHAGKRENVNALCIRARRRCIRNRMVL
jgi:hypothetical protein